MTVWVCGAVMTVSVQTFDNPAGRTSIITVLILIEAIFSWNKMAASHQGLKMSMYFKVCISVCVYSSPVEWLCGCMQVHYECGVCHFPRCVCSNVCVCRRLWMESPYLARWLKSPSLLTWKGYVYKCVSACVMVLYTSEKFIFSVFVFDCVSVSGSVCVGGGAGGHDQSISLIMRSEGCHYGGPSGVQRLLFRKEHRCLLSSEQTRTSLTFWANTTPTRRHLLFPNMLFALMIKKINPFFSFWNKYGKLSHGLKQLQG